ncbi:MAG: sensor histidine kinase [Myxococcota bacterium]
MCRIQPEPGTVSFPTEKSARAARGRFLSIAAHDLRGALSNVRSYAALLLGPRSALDEKARRRVEVIARNADRALALAREVFDSMRHEVGELPIALERLALPPLLYRAAEQVRGPAAERSVGLELAIPQHLPLVEADPERVVHATVAFLRHGLSRSPPATALSLAARVLPSEIYVAVTDVGPPLDAQGAWKALQRDLRVSQESRLAEGFELCLARDEIEAQGGKAGVEPGPDRTTFFFTLPRLAAE